MDQIRIAVVTGASTGLGFETCRRLAGQGYRVVLTAHEESLARAAARTLQAEDLDVEPGVLDVASDDSVRAFAAYYLDTYGRRIHALVNNASILIETNDRTGPTPMSASPLHMPAAELLRAFDNNTLGVYRVTQAFLPLMNEAGYGRVVNVSSGMGALADMGAGWPAYRVSKTGMSALTRIFHHEAAANVKVNAVCPGWVRTAMGGATATRSIDEGVAGIVWAATLPEDGPSGGFFRDGKPIDW